MTNKNSSVYKHNIQCNANNNFDVSILDFDPEEANLRLREAILIRKYQPRINSKAEIDHLHDFLYISMLHIDIYLYCVLLPLLYHLKLNFDMIESCSSLPDDGFGLKPKYIVHKINFCIYLAFPNLSFTTDRKCNDS